jgi:hypothetical protein
LFSGGKGMERISDFLIENEIQDPSFRRLFEDVLARIPDSYAEDFPCFSVYEGFALEGASVIDEIIYFDVSRLTKASGGDQGVLIGIIAHELAHIFLGHSSMIERNPMEGLKLEGEADSLAAEWGFAEEVETFRQKLGPPSQPKSTL